MNSRTRNRDNGTMRFISKISNFQGASPVVFGALTFAAQILHRLGNRRLLVPLEPSIDPPTNVEKQEVEEHRREKGDDQAPTP